VQVLRLFDRMRFLRVPTVTELPMNRKKKINQILKAKQKKMNSKLHKSNKPRYISKAERAKMEEEEQSQQQVEATEVAEEQPEDNDK